MQPELVIPLHLPRVRYGIPVVVMMVLGVFAGFQSTWSNLATSTDSLAHAIGQTLMTIDRIGGIWPLPALMSLGFFGGAWFIVWALVARRPLELRVDATTLSWPSFTPWRAPNVLPLAEITSVQLNAGGDHLMINTRSGPPRLMPGWWIPSSVRLKHSVDRIASAIAAARAR